EAEPLHRRARQARAGPAALEGAPEDRLLAGVAEAGDRRVAVPAEPGHEARHCLRAADREDRDPLCCEVAAAAARERLERDLVAEALDEHDRACLAEPGKGARRRPRAAFGQAPAALEVRVAL